MLHRLMDILACPVCGKSFRLTVHRLQERRKGDESPPRCKGTCAFLSLELDSPERKQEAHTGCSLCHTQEISEGFLTCGAGHAFPIRDAIPRFSTHESMQDRTRLTFDTEWKDYSYHTKIYGHSPEEEFEDLFLRTGTEEGMFRWKTVLDAGCGIGRLCHTLSRLAAEIVGIDVSAGVEQARALNEGRPNVHVVQGDILHPPFRKNSFDCVYSKGVLPYVPDVPRALASLSSCVREEGVLSVSLYPRMPVLFELLGRWVRGVSVRLPVKFNYRLSHLLIPFLPLAWRCSGIRRRSIDWNERAHMIFNWLSSPHQNTATEAELREWFLALGFHRIRFGSIPVGITAVKRAEMQNRIRS